MENPEFWLQFGMAGAFILYLIKQQALWEAEKKEMAGKYEALLREALTRATHIDAKLEEVSNVLAFCQSQGKVGTS